jgi:dipeptidyl aminopeptidase/acylaminoacyl peptidase
VLLALACNLTNTVTPEPAGSQASTAEPPASTESAPLRIVYPDNVNGIRGSNLWIIEGSAAPRQLTSSGQDAAPQFSDDGRLVAFRRIVDPKLDVEELWVINTDGSNEHILVSKDWLSAARPGETTTIFRAEWVPGTHVLAFTIQVVFDEPGFLVDENLYLVDVDEGKVSATLPTGEGAAYFFYSPDGAGIALSSPTTISLMHADGSGWREVASFKGTGLGDGVYVPTVDWSPDGSYLRAAIPSNDLLTPGETLWHIPADGEPASIIGTVAEGFGVAYAPDLQHIAFHTRTASESNVSELHIADGDGTGDGVYVTGASLQWWGWAPDNRRFIYSMDGSAFLGEIGAAPRPLFSDISSVSWPRWVGEDQVIFFSGKREAWQLRLGTPGGTSVLLASPSGDMAQFDFSR